MSRNPQYQTVPQTEAAAGEFDYSASSTIPLPLGGGDGDGVSKNNHPNNGNPPEEEGKAGESTTTPAPRPSLQRQLEQRFSSFNSFQLWRRLFPQWSASTTPESWEELRRQVVAEFIGTFILLFLGLGSVMSASITDSLEGLFQVAAVWCFAVTTAIATVGPISGAHINPAISLAFVVLRPTPEFGWPKFIPYVVAQVLGAALGAWVNFFMYGTEIRQYEVQHGIVRSSDNALATAGCFGDYYQSPVTMTRAFFTEVMGTAFLAGVVFALTHPDNDTTKRNVYVAPFIGICVGALVCTLAPLTGAGMNPARDFGPRIVAYLAGWTNLAFRQAWLYIVAPCFGAPLGAFIADQILFGGYDDTTTAATGPTTAQEPHHHAPAPRQGTGPPPSQPPPSAAPALPPTS